MTQLMPSDPVPAPRPTAADVASLRARLWDAGFRPIEVYNADSSITHSPGKAPRGDDWGDRARQNPPHATTARPDPSALNTGLLCDGLRAIDIDVDNPTLAKAVKHKALDRFGEAPIRIRDGSARCLLLYRAASGEPRKRVQAGTFGKVEVLGRGQQFVAFGMHPSGGALSWYPETPGDITIDALPAITEAEVTAFLLDVAEIIGGKPAPTATDRVGATTSPLGLRADTLQVVAAVSVIPNNGPADWEAWNRIGMAIWAATGGGEAGRSVFHAWSEANPVYDATETDQRWNHYSTSPPTHIGAGTLFHLAKAAPPQLDAEPAAQQTPGVGHNSLPMQFFEDIEPVTDVRDFVQGVLVEQSSAVVYGESNAGKTFFVTNLALHVAAGMDWNGRRVERGGVVYAVLEGGIGFRNRVHAWKTEHGLDDSIIPFVAIPASLNLLDPNADTPRLIAAIKAAGERMGVPVKLVVIDTLSRALAGGNENSPEDMGALVMNMDVLRAATAAMVLFVHHSGKDQARGARGHSSLRAAIDTEIEVVADEIAMTKVATVVKQRDLKKGDTFSFSLETVQVGQNRHGEAITTCIVRNSDDAHTPGGGHVRRRLPQQQQRALEVLADLVAGSGQGGFAGTPAGIPSVPEKWWRERFYDRALPGAEQKAKEKAFRRASDALISSRAVGMSAGRVWVCAAPKEQRSDP